MQLNRFLAEHRADSSWQWWMEEITMCFSDGDLSLGHDLKKLTAFGSGRVVYASRRLVKMGPGWNSNA